MLLFVGVVGQGPRGFSFLLYWLYRCSSNNLSHNCSNRELEQIEVCSCSNVYRNSLLEPGALIVCQFTVTNIIGFNLDNGMSTTGLFMVLPHKRVSCRKVLSMSLFADSKRRININKDEATSRSEARKDHNSSSSSDNKTGKACETPCPLPQPVTVTHSLSHRQGNEIIWFVRDSDSPSHSHTRICFSCLFPILSSL